jgi:hypothetical protein
LQTRGEISLELFAHIKSAGLGLLAGVVAVASVTSGCASVEQTIAQVKESASAALGGGSTTATAPATPPATLPASRGISGTELEGVFKKHPITNNQQPQLYPRAAITITSASASIFRGAPVAGDECITFDVRLWTSAAQDKSFKNLQMCAAQRSKDVPFVSLNTWPGWRPALQNSGAVRGDGPQRPATNFPTDPAVVSAWFDRPSRGIYFIGSILYQIGYDWMQPGEARAWFVSAPLN